MMPDWWTSYPDMRLILDITAGVCLGLVSYTVIRAGARALLKLL
jgi:hypothetical protein